MGLFKIFKHGFINSDVKYVQIPYISSQNKCPGGSVFAPVCSLRRSWCCESINVRLLNDGAGSLEASLIQKQFAHAVSIGNSQ